MSSKHSSVRYKFSRKEVTKDPASLQKVDTRIVDSDANCSHRCTELSTSDREVDFPVVKQRQTSNPCGIPAGANH